MESVFHKCCKFVVKKYLIDFIFTFCCKIFVVLAEFNEGDSSHGILWEIMCLHFLRFIIFLLVIDISTVKWHFLTRTIFQSTQLLQPTIKHILIQKRRPLINHINNMSTLFRQNINQIFPTKVQYFLQNPGKHMSVDQTQ